MRIVNIRITKLGKRKTYPAGDIITKIFAEKNGGRKFGPVEPGLCVDVAKIMGSTGTKSKFSFLHNGILGFNGTCYHTEGKHKS